MPPPGNIQVAPDALTPGMAPTPEVSPDLVELATLLGTTPDDPALMQMLEQVGPMLAQPGVTYSEEDPSQMVSEQPEQVMSDAPPPNLAEITALTGAQPNLQQVAPVATPSVQQIAEEGRTFSGPISQRQEAERQHQEAQLDYGQRIAQHGEYIATTQLGVRERLIAAGLEPATAAQMARDYTLWQQEISDGNTSNAARLAIINDILSNAPMGGGTGLAIAASAAAGNVQAGLQALADLDRAREAGILGSAEAQARQAEASVPILEEADRALNVYGAGTLQDMQGLDEEIYRDLQSTRDAINTLSTMRVDPSRFYANLGTAGTFAAAINVAAGALSSTILNTLAPGANASNVALHIIDQAVEREIGAQMANINVQGRVVGARENLVTQMRGRMQDEIMGMEAARIILMGQAERRLQVLAMRGQGAEVRANALQTINSLRIRRAEQLLDLLIQREAQTRRRGGGGGRRRSSGETADQVASLYNPPTPEQTTRGRLEADFLTPQRFDRRLGGTIYDPEAFGMRVSTMTHGDLSRVESNISGVRSMERAYGQLQTVMNDMGGRDMINMGDSRVRALVDPAVRAFSAALLQSRGVGVLNSTEYQEDLQSAQNPANFLDRFWAGIQSVGPETGVDVIMSRYETALELAQREVEAELRTMGTTMRSPAQLRRQQAAPSAQENSSSPESLLED